MRVTDRHNEYADRLEDLFDKCPKSVLAAIAVSRLTHGGDALLDAKSLLLDEWRILHANGIVTQAPPRQP